MRGDAQMAAADLDEERIALGGPHCREVADRPGGEADKPEAKAEAKGEAKKG